MNKNSVVFCVALSYFGSSFAFAEHNNETSKDALIEGSYIVVLKKPVGTEPPLIKPAQRESEKAGKILPPFGEHGTGQSKFELAEKLGIRGEVVSILDSLNAMHIRTDADEAEKLRQHPFVRDVIQDSMHPLQATQTNPGWGLDRLDQYSTTLNNTYTYTSTGAGQTIYILDSGLNPSVPAVDQEFGGRASVAYDVNVGGTGEDCVGHGTMVASVAGGLTMGVAKGVTLVMGKVTRECDPVWLTNGVLTALNWIAGYAAKGSIINMSLGYSSATCTPRINTLIEDAIRKVHAAGMIVVTSAGNDGCDTANYSTTRLPEAFVVGATNNTLLNSGSDAKASFSRTGSNISAFAPGENVNVINEDGVATQNTGTSFSAPYIAGIFATACQAAAPFCSSGNTNDIYTALRNTGRLGSVTNTDGSPLTGATSRFIWKQAW